MSYYVVSSNGLIVASNRADSGDVISGPFPSQEQAHYVAVELRNNRKPNWQKPLKGGKEAKVSESRRLVCE